MAEIRCPISNSSDVELLERISINDLDALYKRLYGSSISKLFAGYESIEMWKSKESGLIWFEPKIPGDETFYNSLQKFSWYYADYKHEFDIASKYIGINDAVLEVGSGKGNFARFIKCATYTGLDFSDKAREMAALNGIDVRVEDVIPHTEINKEKYDAVCAFQVLEHVPNIKEFLKAMIQGAKVGGKIIIAVPSQDSYISTSNNLALNLPPHHISRYTDAALTNLSNYFPIKLVHLEADPLQPQHFEDYIYQLVLRAIRKKLKMPYRSVDNRFTNQLMKVPAVLIRKFLAPALQHPGSPRGHTVTTIFEKY